MDQFFDEVAELGGFKDKVTSFANGDILQRGAV